MYKIVEEMRECGGFGRRKDQTKTILCYMVEDTAGSGISLRNKKKLAEATQSALNKGEVYLSEVGSAREGIKLLPGAKFLSGKYAEQTLRSFGYDV